MKNYLVITPDHTETVDNATSAVISAGLNKWESALPSNQLRTLELGDQFNIPARNSTIVVVTGREVNV